MQTLTLLRPAALAAAVLLAACGKPETIEQGSIPDPDAAAVNAAAPVELPPALTASAKPYRCKDNSVVFLDLFAGDKQAIAHPGSATAPGVVMKAAEAGQPLTGEGGWKMEGTGATVTLTQPGKGAQSCKA